MQILPHFVVGVPFAFAVIERVRRDVLLGLLHFRACCGLTYGLYGVTRSDHFLILNLFNALRLVG